MTQTSTYADNGRVGIIILFLATVSTGLSAGFFFAWQFASIPGLRLLDDASYIQAMNAMNSTIRNAGFGIPFFGSLLWISLALMLRVRQWQTVGFAMVFSSLVLYLVGLMWVTATIHVPMNIELLSYTNLAEINVELIRSEYEDRWNNWHLVRTCAAIGAFTLLVAAISFEPKPDTGFEAHS